MMDASRIDSLKWEARQRLMLLEAKLIWSGALTTRDLREAFGISRSQATKDLALYQQLAPENVRYDRRRKAYEPTAAFVPAMLHGASREFLRILRLLPEHADTPIVSLTAETGAAEVLAPPDRAFDVRVLQRVNFAVRRRRQLRVAYQSMTQPEPRMLALSPHVLVYTGARWHVRARSQEHDGFRDFLLSRMRGIPEIGDSATMDSTDDWQWQTILPVRIGAHPGLTPAQQAVVEGDYGMLDGVLEKPVRVALIPYYLRLMNVGRGDRERPPFQQQIVLLNPRELETLDRLN